jgi:hypothetical protein
MYTNVWQLTGLKMSFYCSQQCGEQCVRMCVHVRTCVCVCVHTRACAHTYAHVPNRPAFALSPLTSCWALWEESPVLA